MPKGDRLLPHNNVVRYCKKRDLKWGGNPPAPTGVWRWAFEPRAFETDGLSVSWVEYFGADLQKSIADVRANMGLNFKKKDERLAIVSVANIELAGKPVGLHVIEEPEDPPGNPAHSLVKDVVDLADQNLQKAIADTVLASDLHNCL